LISIIYVREVVVDLALRQEEVEQNFSFPLTLIPLPKVIHIFFFIPFLLEVEEEDSVSI
jgi:hypothetical protein